MMLRLLTTTARQVRRLADWLDPPIPTKVDLLMPLARQAVAIAESQAKAGAIRHLLAMKALEKVTGARRRHINAAIDRAVLERYGDD